MDHYISENWAFAQRMIDRGQSYGDWQSRDRGKQLQDRIDAHLERMTEGCDQPCCRP